MTTDPLVDPVQALQSLGYTEREAAFLYLVAVHSGYFMRRQFDSFIGRQRGAIAQHFLEKARSLGHVEFLNYGESRYVYHLFSKPIYRLIGNADSQNRRWKGDGVIRTRLMALDYVLEAQSHHYLTSEEARLHFFGAVRRVPHQLYTDRNGRLMPLLASSPISIADRTQPATAPVCFLFADEALLSEAKFRRFLTTLEPLLRALESFEVIYASTSEHSFPIAEREFWKRFSDTPPEKQNVLGDDWRPKRRFGTTRHAPVQATFTTLCLEYNYPSLRRKELPSLTAVRSPGLSLGKQAIAIKQDAARRGSNVG
jgi:hypothetical protein